MASDGHFPSFSSRIQIENRRDDGFFAKVLPGPGPSASQTSGRPPFWRIGKWQFDISPAIKVMNISEVVHHFMILL